LGDQVLEHQLKTIRKLLRDAKGPEAADKIKDMLLYADSFEWRLAVIQDDCDALNDQISEDYEMKNTVNMNVHAEELYYKLQAVQKEVDITYSVRRVMHLGISEDKHNAFKVIYNMIMNLEKEYFSLNAHKTELESVHNLLDQAEKDGEDHLSMTKILTDVKKASIISYRVWEHLNHSLHHGVEDDMVGARKTLKFA
jgi:hypothetical protein